MSLSGDCDSESLTGLFRQAEQKEKLGQQNEAIEAYSVFILSVTKCAEQTSNVKLPDNVKEALALAYNNRGFLKYRNVDFDDAIDDYSAALCVKPDLLFSFYNRGLIHYRMGRFNQAITDMKSALKLNSTFEPAISGIQQVQTDRDEKLHKHNVNVT